MRNEMTRMAIVGGWTLALITGCSSIPSVGPDYEEPEVEARNYALPDAGAPTTNLTATCEYETAQPEADDRIVVTTNVTHHWWKRFDDPVLTRLVEGSVTNNLNFRMACLRLERANWELLGTYAAYVPKFGVDGGWSRFWNRENTRSGAGRNNIYNLRSMTLDGSWEIDIFGGSRRLTESAIAEAQAAGWSVADAWVELTTRIGAQYIQLRTTQARIDVARTNLVLQSETYDILKSRLDSGIGDELAVNQCAYIVEQTRARLPQLLAAEESLKNSLAILAGDVPGALHEELRALDAPRDWLLQPQKVAEMSLDMMRARPDVKAAERRLAAQVARIGVAKSAWYPKLFITGTVGFENTKSTRLFDRASFLAALGPAINWPIFQGGAIYANVKATETQAQELALAYELAVESAYGQVRDAYAAYTQEYHRYQALKAAVKAATDAVSISQDLYKNGLKDFNNVLDAQRSRLQLEEEFVLSRGQITLDLIDLYRALGGGLAVAQ